MKKIILLVGVLVSIVTSSYAMEDQQLSKKSSLLNQSTDFGFTSIGDQNLPEVDSTPMTSPVVTIHYLLDPEPQIIEDNTLNDGEKFENTTPQPLPGTDELSPLPQSSYRFLPIRQMLQSAYETITSNPWYQNKTVRYSAVAGTGTVTFCGILGLSYWYLKNK